MTHPTSIVQPTSGSNLYGLAWSGFSAPDQQGGSFLGLGRATFGLKKKKVPLPEAEEAELASLRPERC